MRPNPFRRRISAPLLAAAALALVLPAAALAAPERLSIISNGEKTGFVSAETDGPNVRIEYYVDNNGRGPKHHETLVLSPSGVPVNWTIAGTSLMGGKVEERYAWADGRAKWTSQAETGEVAASAPPLYIVNDGSPYAAGIYARAALAAGGSLPVLPGGTVRVAKQTELTIAGQPIDVFRLDGLALAPSYVALDRDRRLFATFGATGATLREGFEAEAPRLLALGAKLQSERVRQISADAAHRFDGPLRIRNVHVFDPVSGTRSAPSTVVVLRDRITQVVPGDTAPTPPDQAEIDGQGGTLFPGLHDMHSHTSLDSGLFYLAAGVTQTRDMGNSNAFLQDLLPRIAKGEIAGPHIVPAGFIEGRSPFSARLGFVADSLPAALDAVRWYADRGYYEVKLYNSFDPAWIAPVAAEAKRLGMGVTGHVPAFETPDGVIAKGYDTIAHINQLMLGWLIKPGEDTRTPLRLTAMERAADLDLASPSVRRTIAAMKRKGIALDTTTMILERLMLSRAGKVAAGDAAYLDHMPIGYQRYRKRSFVTISGAEQDARYFRAFDRIIDTMRLLHTQGIQLLPGTDDDSGVSVHRELELYVRAGYTPAQALRAGSLDAARYLKQDRETGTIERGKRAEFVLVAGDPTKDISEIRRARMVMAGGAVWFPAEIYTALGIRPFADAPAIVQPKLRKEPADATSGLMLFGGDGHDHLDAFGD